MARRALNKNQLPIYQMLLMAPAGVPATPLFNALADAKQHLQTYFSLAVAMESDGTFLKPTRQRETDVTS